MKKQLISAVAVSSMICFCIQPVQSFELISVSVYPQLELNSMVVSGMKAVTSGQTETKQNTKKDNAVTQTKSAVTTQKKLENDLTIEGKVEKNENGSLYHGQSAEELQKLIYDIGQKLIKANGMDKNIQFKYVDKDVENANVNITNTVTVYKGLIKSCQTEDELAYVIGHEIGHANSSHVMKGVGVDVASTAANTAAAYGISRATSNYWAQLGVTTATEVATKMGSSKISRVQETNADLLSIDYIIKAGYNPLASIAIMNKIGDTYLDVLSDHPSTDKRIAKMYNYISLKYPEYADSEYDSVYFEQALTTIKTLNQKSKN